ncbi:MAG: hypothetical protein E7319_09060 [Clostridiales bacterium]|nr:hypothetical protein [Clostridiales bacterium]
MKKYFIASLCRNGILGGGIIVDPAKVTYKTNKLTVPDPFQNLEMNLADITRMQEGWLLCFPTVSLTMKDQQVYRFIVFARKKFVSLLKELGVPG